MVSRETQHHTTLKLYKLDIKKPQLCGFCHIILFTSVKNPDVTIEGVEYYFDENAVMQRGLVTRPDGNTYYYDENGALQRDVTVTIDGITYEVNKDGVAAAVEAPAPEAAGEPAEAAPQPEAAGEPAA